MPRLLLASLFLLAIVRGMPQAQEAAPVAQSASAPITLAGDFGYNVAGALAANGGALQHVEITPGAVWGFNATMGDPAHIQYTTVAGVPGGGWCDLAARYIQAARAFLPPEAIQFQHHGLQLAGVAWEDSIAIWNVGGQAGGQDLLITNTTGRLLTFDVQPAGDGVIVVAALH